ncbi:MAG: hypothetical protein FLDDKLPJ_02577 [Phycisphaerae bacterium]|nr:hypothetical protein [Phycisphaerae bacterium]
MNPPPSATRTFLIACSIVLVGTASWRLLAPKTAQVPAPVSAQSGPPPTPESRNIIVFETDDQRWNTINLDLDDPNEEWVMPNVYNIFIENGVYFPNALVTNPTCCPCRASQHAGGFYSHNTGVLTNTWPNGGAVRFEDENALAVRMKDTNYIDEAYYTVLIGKYMNGYEDLIAPGQDEKARYIPPGWDVFIVPSDSKDWDRGYKITIGGNAGPAVGVILPDDICDDVDNQGVCTGDNWDNGVLEGKLEALGVPTCVIEVLKDKFLRVGNENIRVYTYLPELEQLLAEAFLEGCAEDPNWEVPTPLFMMLTMAPPHGPTQLSAEESIRTLCNLSEHFCDNTQDDYTAGINDYEGRGFGEGVPPYSNDNISDKPSWMQGNPDAFERYENCDNCLLGCYRGPGCGGPQCSDNQNDNCSRDEDKHCRNFQQVFKDELASLHIVDCIVKSLYDAAPDETVFFFTSDHGTMWGEHGAFQKGIPYEEAIRVPFAVAGEGIRTGVEVSAMIAMDLDMPATILEIAGYTRDEISRPDSAGALIKSDGCNLLDILEGTSWGDCYTSAPSGLLPRSQILIQSMQPGPERHTHVRQPAA